MKKKFKIGDKVIWIKALNSFKVEIPLSNPNLNKAIKEYIINKTILTIKGTADFREYEAYIVKECDWCNIYREELKFAQVTDWKERLK